MSSTVFDLFDEYAAAYARGERPSAEAYLDRAGIDRNQLARLLEEYLRRAPVQPPTENDTRWLSLMLAEEPPLLALRIERKMRVDDVVSALVERLGLDPGNGAKVKRYYQRLEGGLLPPLGVSKRLRATLAEVLGADADTALSWTAPPVPPAPAFMRLAEPLAATPVVPESAAGEEDEIDDLFTGGE